MDLTAESAQRRVVAKRLENICGQGLKARKVVFYWPGHLRGAAAVQAQSRSKVYSWSLQANPRTNQMQCWLPDSIRVIFNRHQVDIVCCGRLGGGNVMFPGCCCSTAWALRYGIGGMCRDGELERWKKFAGCILGDGSSQYYLETSLLVCSM